MQRSTRGRSTAALVVLSTLLSAALLGCGGSTGATSSASSAAAPSAAGAPGPTNDPTVDPGEPDPGTSVDNGPAGGDIGDRSKGAVQAQISGGYSATVDLPFGAALAQFQVGGKNAAYLPFTDPTSTLFLTIGEGQILVQYAGGDNVGLTSGATPCTLQLEAMTADQAKGSFSCKGMFLIQGETVGSADLSGTFDAHR